MNIENDVQGVIEGILSGKIIDTFDKYYADDVVMTENGEGERVGKTACRNYEVDFVNRFEFHNASVGRTLIQGDDAAIEWTFELTPKGGSRQTQKQVALQTWKNGKIIREDFYHA